MGKDTPRDRPTETDEIEATPEMIEAGIAIYCGREDDQQPREIVAAIYKAMGEASSVANWRVP